METMHDSLGAYPEKLERRTVLFVDGDASYASVLRDAWRQLHLADELRIVSTREEALQCLEDSVKNNRTAPITAVVLDPDTTEEETGAFLRELRKYCGKRAIPTLFWTRDRKKYEALEGRGVDSVLRKPMVLRLIQEMNAACQLRVRPFHPFRGGFPSMKARANRTRE